MPNNAAAQMNLEIILPSEVHHTKTNTIWYHSYGFKYNKMNLFTNRNKLTDIANKLMVTKGEKDKKG